MRLRRVKNFDSRMERVAHLRQTEPVAKRTERPLYLEIGCGMGTFITTLAARNPAADFLGMEKEENVILRAMEKGAAVEVTNLRFLALDAAELGAWLPENTLNGLYLNFSDPWPHWKDARKRLTHNGFLCQYQKALKPGGFLEMKTDNAGLFAFSLKELAACGWTIELQTNDLPWSDSNVQTEYEARFREQGLPIHKLRAVAAPEMVPVFMTDTGRQCHEG